MITGLGMIPFALILFNIHTGTSTNSFGPYHTEDECNGAKKHLVAQMSKPARAQFEVLCARMPAAQVTTTTYPPPAPPPHQD